MNTKRGARPTGRAPRFVRVWSLALGQLALESANDCERGAGDSSQDKEHQGDRPGLVLADGATVRRSRVKLRYRSQKEHVTRDRRSCGEAASRSRDHSLIPGLAALAAVDRLSGAGALRLARALAADRARLLRLSATGEECCRESERHHQHDSFHHEVSFFERLRFPGPPSTRGGRSPAGAHRACRLLNRTARLL